MVSYAERKVAGDKQGCGYVRARLSSDDRRWGASEAAHDWLLGDGRDGGVILVLWTVLCLCGCHGCGFFCEDSSHIATTESTAAGFHALDLCWYRSRDICHSGLIRGDEVLDGSLFEASHLADLLLGRGGADLPGVPVWNHSRRFYVYCPRKAFGDSAVWRKFGRTTDGSIDVGNLA